MCELQVLDEQLRSIRGSLKSEVVKKVDLQQCIKQEKLEEIWDNQEYNDDTREDIRRRIKRKAKLRTKNQERRYQSTLGKNNQPDFELHKDDHQSVGQRCLIA